MDKDPNDKNFPSILDVLDTAKIKGKFFLSVICWFKGHIPVNSIEVGAPLRCSRCTAYLSR